MLSRSLPCCSLAALAGAAMLALSMSPASAFTLASPSLEKPFASAQVDQVWWDRWGRWHSDWGWRHRHCWRGYSGRLHCRRW